MNKILDRIWSFFSSVKLAVVLILTVIATSIIGTIIQQGLSNKVYIQHYGHSTFRLLNFFDLFDMYHSWWFELLLMLFLINLIACTWERLPAIFKMMSSPKLQIPIEKVNAFKEKQTIAYKGGREKLLIILTNKLKEIYKKPVHTKSADGDFLYLEKGRIARFGPYITHIGLIVIFIGVLIGSFMGFSAYVNLVPGQSADRIRALRGNKIITLPFTIKVNSFKAEFYDSGRPKAYKSDLSLFSGGNQVAHKIIDVNKPLTYKGITIYQASYGQAGASSFRLSLSNNRKKVNNISLKLNHKYNINDKTYIAVLDYSPNYQGFGPTILVGVYKGNKLQNTSIYLQRYPDFHGSEAVNGYKIKLIKVDESLYTGLQVAKDPGTPYVAVGAITLVIGLIMSFLSYRRRLWIYIPNKFKNDFIIAGVADKNKFSFELEFKKIVDKLKKGVRQ